MSEPTTEPTACAGCITRRAFVANAAALAAVATFLAGCEDLAGLTDPTVPVEIKVGDFPGLATIDKLVLVDNQRAVKRTGSTTFAAFSRRCTHEGTAVDLSGTGFLCNNHGSTFDNNGHVTLGPAARDLTRLAASYDATTDRLTIG